MDELGKAGFETPDTVCGHLMRTTVLLERVPLRTARLLQVAFCALDGSAFINAASEGSASILLSGKNEQFKRLAERLKGSAGGEAAEAAYLAAQNAQKTEFSVPYPGGALRFGRRPLIMGVLNVTPDSFYDGGRYALVEDAIRRGMDLAEAGADVIDVGGESTRPGADALSAEEEKRRILRVIEELAKRLPENIPISVDTYKVDVAEAAVSAGARMINDIYGLKKEPALAELAAHHRLPLVLMHIKGEPRTMQKNPRYDNLMGEIVDSLRRSVATALRFGVAPETVIIDPGIGFGKSWEDNLRILNRLVQLKTFGLPILVGVSRKSFIGAVLGKETPDERLYGTLGACAAALLAGASAFRVHDPYEVRETLLVAAAIKQEKINVAD